MFDTIVAENWNRASHSTHVVTTTINEHRAPTDASIKLYEETKDKAYNSIIDVIDVADNLFNFDAVLYEDFHTRTKVCKYIFMLNGKEYRGEIKSSRTCQLKDRYEATHEIYKELAKVITTSIMETLIKDV